MNIKAKFSWLKRAWRLTLGVVMMIGLLPGGTTQAQTTTTSDPAADYMEWPDDEIFLAVPGTTNVEMILGTADSSLMNFSVLDSEITNFYHGERAAASGHMLDPKKESVIYATTDGGSNLWVSLFRPWVVEATGFLNYADMFPATNGCSSFMDIASGDLDDSRDANLDYHDEAVLVYAVKSADYKLPVKIAVMDFTDSSEASPAPVVVTTATAGAKIDASGVNSGSWQCADNALGVTVADVDADGVDEIALAYQTSKDAFRVDVYRYTTAVDANGNKTHSLSLWESEISSDLPDAYVSLDIAAADFDGDGKDEVATAISRKDSTLHAVVNVRTFYFPALPGGNHIASDRDFKPNITLPIRVQIEPGLFGRPAIMEDPDNPNLAARELAVAYTIDANNYTIEMIAFGPPDEYEWNWTSTAHVASAGGQYFWLAAGGFKGPRTADDYYWTLAATSWADEGANDRYVVNLSHPTAPFVMGDYGWWEYPAFPAGWDYPSRYPIIATDYDGDSVYLGAPTKLVMEEVYQYKMILQEPPKHAYWDKHLNEVVTISRWDDFYVEFKESADYDYSTSTKHESDRTLSTDASLSIGASKKFGKPLRRKEIGVDFKGTIDKDWKEHEEEYNSNKTSYGYKFSRETTRDDVVSAEVMYYEIWRYPVYAYEDVDANGNVVTSYLDIVMPSNLPTLTSSRGATTFDGWEPAWENGNILSYPQYSADCNTPADLGTFRIACTEGSPGCVKVSDDPPKWEKEIHQAMAWGLLGSDAAGGTQEISMTKSEGSGTVQTYSESLGGSAELKAHFSGKVYAGIKLESEVEVGFHGESSWADTSTAENTTSTTRSLFLSSPAPTQLSESYTYAPILYVTDSGSMKLTYCVDLPGSGLGRDTWLELYGDVYGKPGKPDPALNLPYRFKATFSENMHQNGWEPEHLDIYRNQIRGFFVKEPELDPNLNDYLLLDHDPIAGEPVRLEVRVNNYSLSAAHGNVTNLKVKFYATAIDPVSGEEIVQDIGTVTIPSLLMRQVQVAAINWTPMAIGGAGQTQLWRVHVVLDPDNVIDEIYDSDDPATFCPLDHCTAEEYIDPGQNNYGFREVSVVNSLTTGDLRRHLPKDISLGKKAMLALNRSGKFDSGTTQVYLGSRVPVRVHVTSDKPAILGSMVRLYEGDPDNGGKLLAEHRILPGIPGSTGNSAWFLYTPMTIGPHYLYTVVVESSDDLRPGNNIAQIKVVVIPPPKGPNK